MALGDAPEPGVHDQRLPACHVVQQGIKLGAVADPLSHLGLEHSRGGNRSEGGYSRFLSANLSRVVHQPMLRPGIGPAKAGQAALQEGHRRAWLAEGCHEQPHCLITRGQRGARALSTIGWVGAAWCKNV